MGRGFGKDGGEEAVTVASHGAAPAALCSQQSAIAATPIRAIIFKTTFGQEKTRGWPRVFQFKS
jgi:hypothetical protein